MEESISLRNTSTISLDRPEDSVHVLTCSIGYLLAVAAYAKAKKTAYKRNLDNFLDDLRTIRLSSSIKKQREGKNGKLKVTYALEEIDAPHTFQRYQYE